MKQSPAEYFKKAKDALVGGVSIKNCTPNFITLLYSVTDRPTCLFVDDSVFSAVYDSCSLGWEDSKVLWVPPLDESMSHSPPGFVSSYDRSIMLFRGAASSVLNSVRLVVCSFSQRKLPIPISPLPAFIVDSSSTYEDLCLFLEENNYELVDVVCAQLQYSRRGAIIDFFPPTGQFPLRASFYDEVCLHSFDLNSQMTVKKLPDYSIPPTSNLDQNNTKEFQSLIDGLFVQYSLNASMTLSGVFHDGSSVDFPFKLFSFSDFSQNKKINFEVLDGSVVDGFQANNRFWIPEWFLNTRLSSSQTAQKQSEIILSGSDLSVGDYVVHEDCGVGLFRGSKILYDDDGCAQELVVLEYIDGGMVSLDTNHLHKLSFYADHNAEGVILDSLSKRGAWEKKKRSAKKQADEVVDTLVSAYAIRTNISRPPFIKDSEIEGLFLAQFPYEETVDQKRVWEEISKDLSENRPMDRLLCGDVGFGKTEIAIRAAFRAITNSRRVLVLAPTTILAQQLTNSFLKRLSPFGGKVRSVSRFSSQKDVLKTKELWVKNTVDVLVGTHALLYDSIYLDRIGLIVVDEEHRFGVKQKEKILSIKHNVDILSMSATPIPRTLNMALSGVRQISTLNSAPKSRLPIETHVSYFDNELIKRAVLNEKRRGGQLFFVHNNVKTLKNYVDFFTRLVPGVSIGVVNGQMPSKKIETVMDRFINKKIDLLICTSIIETGIDIANANTVIINNAHRFGLAQLYQIRGRVGRGFSQAYAYLLLPKGRVLKKNSYKRLKAIEENTHLGAGYNISNMDLEIRGGGAVFGYKQSGGIGGVGFELYSKYIKEVLSGIKEKKPIKPISPQDVVVNIFKSNVIPEEYIESPSLRISFYRKLGIITNISELNSIKNEMTNRFGPIPKPVSMLFVVWEIKLLASSVGVLSVEQNSSFLSFTLSNDILGTLGGDIIKFVESFNNKQGWKYSVNPNKNNDLGLVFTVDKNLDISSKVLIFMNKLQLVLNNNLTGKI